MSEHPKSILIWAPYGAGPHYWGPGQNAWRLVRYMNKAYRGEFVFDLAHGYPEQQHVEPFQNVYCMSPLVNGDLRSLQTFLKASRAWLKAHAHEYHAIHSVSSYDAGLLPATWFSTYNPSGVATTRIATKGEGLWPGSLRARLLLRHFVRRSKAKKLTTVIALSSEIEADLKSIAGLNNIIQIPNGVDTEHFRPATPVEKREARKALGIHDAFTVLFVGSISERKQPHVLIEALLQLPHRTPAVQVLLAGPVREGDAESQRIDALLEEHPHLKTRVHRIGFRDDTRMLYHAADVFALPSQKEGMSNALLEAQSSGLPAIVTPVSGSTDIIEHGRNGYVTVAAAKDVASWVSRLSTETDTCERVGVVARARIIDRFSLDSVSRRYAVLWQKN